MIGKAGYGIRAVYFADIPRIKIVKIKRQNPRSAARMSENAISCLRTTRKIFEVI